LYSTYSATDDVAGSVTNGDPGQFSVAILRDSDNAVRSFTPAEVADGTANTWVQAGVGGAANGFVRRGYDQSVTALDVSNLNHGDQSDPTKMPKLFDSATGLVLQNGKAAIEFDGVNDFLPFTEISFTNNSFASVVANIGGVRGRVLSSSDLKNADFYWFAGGVASNLINAGSSGVIFGSNTTYLGTQSIMTVQTSASTLTLHINSVIDMNSTGLTVGNFSIQQIGRQTQEFSGSFQFCVIYPANQSANRPGIETAINNEYSIYP
jgi:hypothetical protein